MRTAAFLILSILASAQTSGVWLDVPFVAQPEDGCGAASIAMILQYWTGGPPADVAAITRSLVSREAHGIYASDLERYLRQQGYRTFALRGEWSDLEEQLGRGRPLIVALQPGKGALHYVVLTGLDPSSDAVVKNDPAVRKALKQHRREFLDQWKAAGYWTLLALPSQ